MCICPRRCRVQVTIIRKEPWGADRVSSRDPMPALEVSGLDLCGDTCGDMRMSFNRPAQPVARMEHSCMSEDRECGLALHVAAVEVRYGPPRADSDPSTAAACWS